MAKVWLQESRHENLTSLPFVHDKNTKGERFCGGSFPCFPLVMPSCMGRRVSFCCVTNAEVTFSSLQFCSHDAQLCGVYLQDQGTRILGTTLSLMESPTLAAWSLLQGQKKWHQFFTCALGFPRDWVDFVASSAVSQFSDQDCHSAYEKIHGYLHKV